MLSNRITRVSDGEAVDLLKNSDLLELGRKADEMRQALHPDGAVTFVIDRNINYTNVCTCRCSFCGFYRSVGDKDAYVLDKETLASKINETKELDGTQILLQGGLHPDLKIDFYEDLLRYMKSFNIWVHGFSPPEIHHIASLSGLSITETLKKLMDAGLDSMPGGGAELLVDSERMRISPNKINSAKWLGVMEEAHKLGMKTTATMMFKQEDEPEKIVEHLAKVRKLQDRTGGFTAFIPWPFQPDNTELGGAKTSPVQYLRVLALCRLYLDNMPNIQVSWVTQGPEIGQTALRFGGNDFGSLMIEENVVASCGATYSISVREIVHNINRAGFKACQRDMQYNRIRSL
ncbi:cyclic dehypoxanthinyl futalosine synthase [Limisalsivibrio acetivorans]|uniref:cyclic dehypoxanthinyl futalosine synthase n=1 Tax=Limisalsivibrio acetivorans TaxID=1304888 RepID=UPI00040CEFD7|nr:cyclic dehypoxanthinyl futalosine synthase [Limisalsivibrio acetivorans]